jgi:hypothetical protein
MRLTPCGPEVPDGSDHTNQYAQSNDEQCEPRLGDMEIGDGDSRESLGHFVGTGADGAKRLTGEREQDDAA